MKIIIAALFLVVLAGCMKNQQTDQLAPGELNAVELMNRSYQRAVLNNDSMILTIQGTIYNGDTVMVHCFDSAYHQCLMQFDSCHQRYQHNTTSSDHSHNQMGNVMMHQSPGGMMGQCQCCSNGGHGSGIHQQMGALKQAHASYHP
jgi:hypothetical protein